MSPGEVAHENAGLNGANHADARFGNGHDFVIGLSVEADGAPGMNAQPELFVSAAGLSVSVERRVPGGQFIRIQAEADWVGLVYTYQALRGDVGYDDLFAYRFLGDVHGVVPLRAPLCLIVLAPQMVVIIYQRSVVSQQGLIDKSQRRALGHAGVTDKRHENYRFEYHSVLKLHDPAVPDCNSHGVQDGAPDVSFGESIRFFCLDNEFPNVIWKDAERE